MRAPVSWQDSVGFAPGGPGPGVGPARGTCWLPAEGLQGFSATSPPGDLPFPRETGCAFSRGGVGWGGVSEASDRPTT